MPVRCKKIVVLDAGPIRKGGRDVAAVLNHFGPVEVYDSTSPGELSGRCEGADIVFTNKVPLDGGTLVALPELRFIGVLATGYNVVDVAAARQRKIAVANARGYAKNSVAQHVFALLLNATNHVAEDSERVGAGGWSTSNSWCFTSRPLIGLSGKTLGIIG